MAKSYRGTEKAIKMQDKNLDRVFRTKFNFQETEPTVENKPTWTPARWAHKNKTTC